MIVRTFAFRFGIGTIISSRTNQTIISTSFTGEQIIGTIWAYHPRSSIGAIIPAGTLFANTVVRVPPGVAISAICTAGADIAVGARARARGAADRAVVDAPEVAVRATGVAGVRALHAIVRGARWWHS